MTKERALMNFGSVKPTTKVPKGPTEELTRIGEASGFTTRHAPAPAAVDVKETDKILTKSGRVDGRSLRCGAKTNCLNVAVKPEVEQVLWAIAEELTPEGQKLMALGDVLESVIGIYRRHSAN